jgi:tetratricopeptide (TPR) repeat protein
VPEIDPRQIWWEQARSALAEQNWPLLEGTLLRLLEAAPQQPEFLDLLGHALLMQGNYAPCRDVLEEALRCGSTSFWTPHKLGDAHRGLQRAASAIPAYEQALRWGSNSPITVRNLLEVLHGEAVASALARLEAFAAESPPPWSWSEPPTWLRGACDAATRVQGDSLAGWLCERGCPDGPVRAVVWQENLHRLEIPAALRLLDGSGGELERALAQRLQRLLQLP